MKALLVALFLLLPGMAWAEFELVHLVGAWAGEGRYVDGATGGKLRCRLTVNGHKTEVLMASRCASGAGSAGYMLRLRQSGGGAIVATIEQASGNATVAVDELQGRPGGSRVILRGGASDETAVFVLRFDSIDMLFIAGEYIQNGTRQASTIDFRRQ